MENETPLDPFAVDFFGVRRSVQPEEDEKIKLPGKTVEKKSSNLKSRTDWFVNLPKFSVREAEFSNTLQKFPVDLTEKIVEKVSSSLAYYTFSSPEKVKCSVISVSEINLNEASAQLEKSPQIFLNFNCQPEKYVAVVSFNSDFAASVINLILGGKGSEVSSLKSLSPIEQTIVEFVSVNIFSEINDLFGQTLFCLQSVSEKISPNFDSQERGAEIVLRTDFEFFSGIITLLVSRDFLRTVRQNRFAPEISSNKLNILRTLTPKIDLRLLVGTTTLEADNLLFLEINDVILIEKPEISNLREDFSSTRQIFAGDGINVRLNGFFLPGENANNKLNFQITEFTSEEKRRVPSFSKFKMDVNDNDFLQTAENTTENEPPNQEIDEPLADEDLSALENVQVNLRVEIAGDKISLRELQNIRAGQIIALGCRPTDPVRLVIDNSDQPIAAGELVEIEGQLGVRLTKVFI